jgi:hypothetical protein
MNAKQAIALAIGTIAAMALILMPPMHTRLQQTSTKILPNGSIQTVETSHLAPWQPAGFVLVVVVTGFTVYRLNRKS